jgi:hypothetical protein
LRIKFPFRRRLPPVTGRYSQEPADVKGDEQKLLHQVCKSKKEILDFMKVLNNL